MLIARRVRSLFALAAIALSACLVVLACQSENRSTTTDTSASEGAADRHGDAMLDADTQRAKEAMEANQRREEVSRPAAPRRDTSRAVDQPRPVR